MPPRRKRFGQHFLHDPAVLERIVDGDRAARRRSPRGDRSGPRRPHRAAARLRLTPRLDAIEIDRDLAALLRRSSPATPRCTAARRRRAGVRLRGARRAARRPAARRRQPALQHLHAAAVSPARAAPAHIDDLHVMLQREVVDRMAAAARRRGLRPPHRHAGAVGRRSSAVRRRARAPSSRRPGCGRPSCASPCARQPLFAVSPHFAPVVAAAFSQRRKTLRNALSALLTPRTDQRLRHRSRRAARDAHARGVQQARRRLSTARCHDASLARRLQVRGTAAWPITVAFCWSST